MTDIQLRNAVQDRIERETTIDAIEIGVTVRDGIVTLTGLVSDYGDELAAVDIAARVKGVCAVANNINLRFHGVATDSDIAKAAVEALGRQSSLPRYGIRLTVKNGWVYLKGEVDAEFEKSAAEKCVECLSGVRGVMKHVVVKPRASVAQRGAATQADFAMTSAN